jgi:hypothetical protein
METPNERFTRLAEARMNKILDGYRLIANLKGSNYKSTQEQRIELIQVLRQGLDELEAVLAGEKIDKTKFKFSSFANGHDTEEVIQ